MAANRTTIRVAPIKSETPCERVTRRIDEVKETEWSQVIEFTTGLWLRSVAVRLINSGTPVTLFRTAMASIACVLIERSPTSRAGSVKKNKNETTDAIAA